MSDDDKARREQIASDINGFLRSVGAPFVVNPEDVVVTADGAQITRQVDDVHLTVEVGAKSLMHVAVLNGLIGGLTGKR